MRFLQGHLERLGLKERTLFVIGLPGDDLEPLVAVFALDYDATRIEPRGAVRLYRVDPW